MTTAKKTTTTKAKNTTTQKSVTATKLVEREPKVLAEQAFYAYASVLNDVVETGKALPTTVKQQAPKNLDELKTQSAKLRDDLLGRVQKTRESATRTVDSQLDAFGKRFDKRAKDGKAVLDGLRAEEPVKSAETQLKVILDQSKNTRSQVKAAVTSVKKIGEVAGEAADKQRKNAESQVKAAVTSTKKTVDTVRSSAKKVS